MFLAKIKDVPENPVYRKSFVRYNFGNILIYDHRRDVLETKGDQCLFEKRFKKPARLQVVDRRGYIFFNIFELETDEVDESNLLVLVLTSSKEENVEINKYPISWVCVNVSCGFVGTHKQIARETLTLFRQKDLF